MFAHSWLDLCQQQLGGAQDQCKDPERLQGGVAERPKPGSGLSTHTQPWGADASVRVGE